MNYRPTSSNLSVGFFFVLLFMFLSASCFGQDAIPTVKPIWTNMQSPAEGTTFEDIQQNFNDYWRDREIGKGHGYKPFKRWEAYMAPRIYPSNDMNLVGNTYHNYMEWERKQNLSSSQDKSFAGNWTAMGPFVKAVGEDTGVGRINMVRFDPANDQIMYVGAANGGLWKSINGGGHWETMTDFLEIIGVADLVIQHPTPSTTTLYMATGDAEGDRRSIGVLKSIDGGTNWTTTGLTWMATDAFFIRNLIMPNPATPNVMLASTNKGIFHTSDGWANFTSTQTGHDFKDMVIKPNDPMTVYACGTTLWKSTNQGVGFTPLTTGVPSANVERLSIAVTPAQPNWVYLMAGRSDNQGLLGIYISTNSGTTFTPRHVPTYDGSLGTGTNINILGNDLNGGDAAGQAFFTAGFAASPTFPDFLLVGGVSQWASDDGGLNWYVSSYWAPEDGYQFVHADTHEIIFSPDGTKAFSSCDGGLSMYTDNDNHEGPWVDLSNNLNISQQESIGMSATTENLMIVGLQDIGTILNTAPSTWKVIGGGDGEYNFIDRTSDMVMVETGTNGSHAISTDGGLTEFTPIVNGIDNTGGVEFKSPIKQDPVNKDIFYAGGRVKLHYSADQGANWVPRGGPFSGLADEDSRRITEFQIAPSNNQIIYATNGFNFAKSIDAGVNWTDMDLPNTVKLTQIAISNIDPNKVWVTCSGYAAGEKVYYSSDGASSWTNISGTLPNIPFNTVVFQNGSNDLVYVGADVGVFHHDAVATDWTSFFTALPRTQIKDLKIFYPTMKLRAGTFGRGTWQTDAATSSLPVNLRSFTGVNAGKVNRLNWVTTEEIDLAHYEVERSTDGAAYTNIGKVLPLNGRDSERSYNFDDVRPEIGANYYRLKITDLDGTFEFSRIVTLFVDDADSDISVFPNPASNVLKFKGLSDASATVRVMDALGRTLIVQSVSTADGINISRLPNGTYFLEIRTADDASVVKRFVKE